MLGKKKCIDSCNFMVRCFFFFFFQSTCHSRFDLGSNGTKMCEIKLENFHYYYYYYLASIIPINLNLTYLLYL